MFYQNIRVICTLKVSRHLPWKFRQMTSFPVWTKIDFRFRIQEMKFNLCLKTGPTKKTLVISRTFNWCFTKILGYAHENSVKWHHFRFEPGPISVSGFKKMKGRLREIRIKTHAKFTIDNVDEAAGDYDEIEGIPSIRKIILVIPK